jgi:hypothetical protein
MLVIKAAAPARLREINAASARRVGCVFRPISCSHSPGPDRVPRGSCRGIPEETGPGKIQSLDSQALDNAPIACPDPEDTRFWPRNGHHRGNDPRPGSITALW